MADHEKNSLHLQRDLYETQRKLDILDKNYGTLKGLSKTAVQEFEGIKLKCKEYHQKFQGEHQKYLKAKEDLDRLKEISSLALDEYENLHRKYEVEQECRGKAVEIASKMVYKNKQLKRQSQMILTHISELNGEDSINLANLQSFENDSTSEDSESESFTSSLQEEIRDLKDMVENLRKELSDSEESFKEVHQQFSQEKEAHAATRKKMSVYEKQLRQLNRVSVLAFDEFNILQQRYELEAQCRVEAEKIASEAKRNDKELHCKSKILKEANRDERLAKAFEENDTLNKQLEQERSENEEKIKELLEELQLSKDCEYLKGMQNKLDVAQEQVDNLENQVIEAEKKATEAAYKVSQLEKSLEDAKKATPAPPPPPMAPPPPPPPPQHLIKKFMNIMGPTRKKKGSSTKRGKEPKDPVADAMKEMMDRINKGQIQLKPVSVRQNKSNGTEDSSAMSELGSLLKTMKTKSTSSLSDKSPTSKANEECEWGNIKLRKRTDGDSPRKTSVDPTEDSQFLEVKSVLRKPRSRSTGDLLDERPKEEATSELKKILQKQKAVAERDMEGEERLKDAQRPREEKKRTSGSGADL